MLTWLFKPKGTQGSPIDKTGGAALELVGSGAVVDAVIDRSGGAALTFTTGGGSAFTGGGDARRSLRWIGRRRRDVW